MSNKYFRANYEYLAEEPLTHNIVLIEKEFNNKILSDEIDENLIEWDKPDYWFLSLFDNIYKLT